MQKFRVRENSEESPINANLIEYQAQILTKTEIEKLTNTSFPKSPHESFWGFIGIDPVLSAPKPEATDLQIIRIDGAVQDGLGNWVDNWVVEDKFKDYTDENGNLVTKADQEATFLTDQLTAAKQSAVKSLHQKCDEKLASLAADYPERETQTWSVQLKEAEAYKLDPSSPTPFILGALKPGETVEQYADLIIANNAVWSGYAGSIVLIRRSYEEQISSADITTVRTIQEEIQSL